MTKANQPPASQRAVGQTRSAGFQVGARRAMPIDTAGAWRLLTSGEGVRLWLGDAPDVRFEPGATYALADGTRGEVRVCRPGGHLRLTWQPPGWARPSTIQIRVIAGGPGATIAFHQEWLPGAPEREQRRQHYQAVLAELERRTRQTSEGD